MRAILQPNSFIVSDFRKWFVFSIQCGILTKVPVGDLICLRSYCYPHHHTKSHTVWHNRHVLLFLKTTGLRQSRIDLRAYRGCKPSKSPKQILLDPTSYMRWLRPVKNLLTSCRCQGKVIIQECDPYIFLLTRFNPHYKYFYSYLKTLSQVISMLCWWHQGFVACPRYYPSANHILLPCGWNPHKLCLHVVVFFLILELLKVV